MLRFPFLLILLVWFTTADRTTKLSLHYSEVLKIKCDALPYRTAFIEANCYIVIDNDGSDISNKCSTVLTGAKFVGDAPETVWSQLFVEKGNFVVDENSTGKKKAMCVFESQFPPSTNLPTLIAGTTVRQEELKLTANMKMPFRLPFTKPVEVGQTIIIKGFFTASIPHFMINLQSGTQNMLESERLKQDISFHAYFRPASGKNLGGNTNYPGEVVLKTMIKGGRHRQEADCRKKNPIGRGSFDVRIRILENAYQMFVNQTEFYVYKSHLSYNRIANLYIDGNGYLDFVQLGESYDPVPYSTALSAPLANRSISRIEEKEERKPLPYVLPLSGKIEPGRVVVIKGFRMPPRPKPYPKPGQAEILASVFMLMLQAGGADTRTEKGKKKTDIHFHFNIRIHMGHISFNTIRKGVGNKEQLKPNPFKTGDPIDIRIRILQNAYQVFFNEREFYVYKAKMPFTPITHLWLFGKGSITDAYMEEKYYPVAIDNSFANGFPMCYKESCSTQREWYTSRLQVADCKSLFVSGVAQGQNFTISLVSKNGNIALKFNPRFDKKNVGLNSFKNKQWLVEETVNKLPFEKNVPFDVAISNEANGFQIFVNGDHFVTYVHRTCPFDINVVEIEGIFDLNVQVK